MGPLQEMVQRPLYKPRRPRSQVERSTVCRRGQRGGEKLDRRKGSIAGAFRWTTGSSFDRGFVESGDPCW